jgi:hypothetical protein
MTIAESADSFGRSSALTPALSFAPGRTPLNVAAAHVASTLRHRVITPAILAGLMRLADFIGLAVLSFAISTTYVDPRDAGAPGYLVASVLLPAATTRAVLPEDGRGILACLARNLVCGRSRGADCASCDGREARGKLASRGGSRTPGGARRRGPGGG